MIAFMLIMAAGIFLIVLCLFKTEKDTSPENVRWRNRHEALILILSATINSEVERRQ